MAKNAVYLSSFPRAKKIICVAKIWARVAKYFGKRILCVSDSGTTEQEFLELLHKFYVKNTTFPESILI